MPHQCTNCGRTFPDGSKEMLSGCPDCGGNKFQFAPASTVGRSAPDVTSGGTGTDAASTGSASDGVGGPSETAATTESESEAESEPETGAVSRAAETVRDWVSDSHPEPDDDRSRSWFEEDESEREPTVRRSPSRSFPEWPDTARPPEDRSESTSSESASARPDSTSTRSPSSPDRSSPASSADPSSVATDDSEDTAQADARSAVVTPDELPDPPESTTSGTDGVDGPEVRPDHGRVVSEPSGERPSLEDLREELNDQFESIKVLQPGQYELNLMELYDREEYIVSLQEDGRYVIDVPDSWINDE